MIFFNKDVKHGWFDEISGSHLEKFLQRELFSAAKTRETLDNENNTQPKQFHDSAKYSVTNSNVKYTFQVRLIKRLSAKIQNTQQIIISRK